MLAAMLRRAHLPIVHACDADWSAMPGDDRRRSCGECEREVLHLSRMTIAEALAAIEPHVGGRVCVRYRVDRAGAVEFADPPPRRQGPALARAALVTAVLAACTGHGDDDREPTPPEAVGLCSPADEQAGLCPGGGPPPPEPPAPEPPPDVTPIASEPPAARGCDGLVDAVPVPDDRPSGDTALHEHDMMGVLIVSKAEARRMRREARRAARRAR
jgi:hypothetical protein